MSVFTVSLRNVESTILFMNIWSVIAILVLVTLVGLFIIGNIPFWKARLKKLRIIVFQE